MAKSLGMIHTVNNRAGPFTGVNQRWNIDLPGELTEQLQRMVRAGTFHKLVGVDMTAEFTNSAGTPGQAGSISGHLRYFAPTRGRCEAFRGAFRSMAEVMKSQGVAMRDNAMYDFRAPLNNDATINTFLNRATLDGTTGLGLTHSTTGASIFGVHNEGVQPVSTTAAGDVFTSGFDTILQGAGGTDFVLNDALPFTGNHEVASEVYEEIPFTLGYVPAAAGQGGSFTKFEFRPDPALYVAIMCGQLQIVIDNIDLGPGTPNIVLEVNAQVAGWKSIMGSPDKKRSSKKKIDVQAMTDKQFAAYMRRRK